MKIATAGSRSSKRWKTIDKSWDWLLEQLREPKRTGETVAEYRRMTKDEQAQRKDVGGFVGGALDGPRRKAEAVTERWLVTLDADEASMDDVLNFELLFDLRHCVYSTHSHTPEAPRLRWIFPMTRAVTPEEYQAIARKVAEWIGIEGMDPTTYQPERLMYWPSCPEDGDYFYHEVDGPILSPDVVLREYGDGDAWKDVARWPISSKERAVVKREAKRQGAPENKPGIVGRFCRAYDVPAAIDRWLSDIYAPCDNSPGRYTYLPGSSSGGAVLYDDGRFLFSHHSTDPTEGQLCNAFDLVRLHLFGAQDDGKEAQDINRRPSYRAMCDMIAQDEECRQAFFSERIEEFADLGDVEEEITAAHAGAKQNQPEHDGTEETEDDLAWVSELEVNRKTGEADSTINNATLILRNDPRLKNSFGLDEFTGFVTVKRDLPWRRDAVGSLWQDSDDANLFLFMETQWKFTGEQKIRTAWSVVVKENAYHQVRDYLKGLKWDGKDRLDTLLVRYMGAEDTEYVRTVTRKWMVAAVKRVMQPGCKFDGMLVLVGQQGIGKSRLAFLLSKGWFTDSLTRMDGKEAYEALRGAWIVEIAELAAAKRSEQEAQKKFLSAQYDLFRPAYGRNVQRFDRQCVFYGSTNDQEPLKDDTGARRYWPVICAGKDKGQHIGLEAEVDQLWAEAVTRYRAGESVWLDDEKVSQEAEQVQAMLTVQDDMIGLIERFLEIKLPEDWDQRDAGERAAYCLGNTLDDPEKVGVLERRMVSIPEIRVEGLGERREDIRGGRDGTNRRIASAMSKMPGWSKYRKKFWLGEYGAQWVYVRDGYDPEKGALETQTGPEQAEYDPLLD